MRLAALALAALMLAAPSTAVVQNGTSPSNDPGEGQMGITSEPEATRTSQTFGSSGGPRYDVTFTATNTTPELTGDKVVDVSKGNRSLHFTGYIELPTPCHELSTGFEETGEELIMTVEANASGTACAQQVVTKVYSAEVESSEPFRLEVRHATTGMEIRTMETQNYSPGGDATVLDLIAAFIQWLL